MFGSSKDVFTSPDNINSIDVLVGRTVLSRLTANEIGHVYDLLVDPAEGELSGLVVQLPDESLRLVDSQDVSGFGPDAVMIDSEESAVLLTSSPLKGLPGVKGELLGAKVITDTGKVLGQVAKVYLHIAQPSLFIYEIRSSILDKLLGHSLYIPGSAGRAFSSEAMRLIVSDEAVEHAGYSLDDLANQMFEPPSAEGPMVIVRSRGHDVPGERRSI